MTTYAYQGWGGLAGPLTQAAVTVPAGGQEQLLKAKVTEAIAANASINVTGNILTDTDQGFVVAGVVATDLLRFKVDGHGELEVTVTAVTATTLTFTPTIPSVGFQVSPPTPTPVRSYLVGDPNRLPDKDSKALVVTNKQGAANNIYLGKTGVLATAFVLELKAADAPGVIDMLKPGTENWFAFNPGGAPVVISVAQVG